MEFLRTIGFTWPPWSSDQRAVSRDRLPGAGRREHRPQRGQVFQSWDHFLDPGHGNVNARQAGGKPPVAFVGGEGNRANVGDDEVRAGNPHLRRKEGLAELAPCGGHQFHGIVAQVRLQFLAEEVADLRAVEMHGRCDDVIGRLMTKLHDVLAEIGLPGFDPELFQCVRQFDLFRHHGLRLYDRLYAATLRQIANVSAGLLGVFRPEDMTSPSCYFFLKLEQVSIEMVDGFTLDLLATPPGRLPILKTGAAFQMRGIVTLHVLADDLAVHQVSRLDGSVMEEPLRGCERSVARSGTWSRRVHTPAPVRARML